MKSKQEIEEEERNMIDVIYSIQVENLIKKQLILAQKSNRVKINEWGNFINYDIIQILKGFVRNLDNLFEKAKEEGRAEARAEVEKMIDELHCDWQTSIDKASFLVIFKEDLKNALKGEKK